MPNLDQDAAPRNNSPLKPMPVHLFDALVTSVHATLGTEWGSVRNELIAHARQIQANLQDVGDAYLAGEPEINEHGLHLEVWVDVADLNPGMADAVAMDALGGPEGQEIMLTCRSYEGDGIRYRFARGSIESGVIGSLRLIGPYARDVARLGSIGSGQIQGFSA